MNNFAFVRPAGPAAAVEALSANPGHRLLGGGTNLVDLMREEIEHPTMLVDVSRMMDAVVPLPDGGIRIGASVRNSALAAHPEIRSRYPVLSQAILNGASGQIRNMATTAGNVMQRTRCTYFYDGAAHCNKRVAGAGCDAREGSSRNHAILGASPDCIATHPSDLCVALVALDASVNVDGPAGPRTIPMTEFHRLPGATPQRETALDAGDMITSVDLPPLPFAQCSLYLKARDRASYAFALVSVAAALQLREGRIVEVRLALGGVAHKPWRAFTAERLLLGQVADASTFLRAAQAELASAAPTRLNEFKVQLGQNLLVDALAQLTQETAR